MQYQERARRPKPIGRRWFFEGHAPTLLFVPSVQAVPLLLTPSKEYCGFSEGARIRTLDTSGAKVLAANLARPEDPPADWQKYSFPVRGPFHLVSSSSRCKSWARTPRRATACLICAGRPLDDFRCISVFPSSDIATSTRLPYNQHGSSRERQDPRHR